ncbi:MAG: hypothetical protein GXO26_04590 [Crenarchaeota archaeon]|nr:hypothetical protein [Thermoproteota archaeon]
MNSSNIESRIETIVENIVEAYLNDKRIIKVIARPGYGKSFISVKVFEKLYELSLVEKCYIITQNNAQLAYWSNLLTRLGIGHIVLFGRSGNILGIRHTCKLGLDPSSPSAPCNRISKRCRVLDLGRDEATGRIVKLCFPCKHAGTWYHGDLSNRRGELEKYGYSCVTFRDARGNVMSFIYPGEVCSYYHSFLQLYTTDSSIVLTNMRMFMLHYRFSHLPFQGRTLLIFDEYDVTTIDLPVRRFSYQDIYQVLKKLSNILQIIERECKSSLDYENLAELCRELQFQIDEALSTLTWLRRHVTRKLRVAVERDLARLRSMLLDLTRDSLQLLEYFPELVDLSTFEDVVELLYQIYNASKFSIDLLVEADDIGNITSIAFVGRPWSPIRDLSEKHYILLTSATELPQELEREALGETYRIETERKLPLKILLVKTFTLPFTYRNYERYRRIYVENLKTIIEEVLQSDKPTLIFAKSPKYVEPIINMVRDYCDWIDRSIIGEFLNRKVPVLVTCSLDRGLDLSFIENLVITVDLVPNISSAEFRLLEKLYKKNIITVLLNQVADNTLYQLLGRVREAKTINIYSPDLRIAWRIARLVRKGLIEAIPHPTLKTMLELADKEEINWNNLTYELIKKKNE